MGMFDTVNFYCPKCDGQVSTQSKSGPSLMNEYRLDGFLPAGIAEDLRDHGNETCPHCAHAITFEAQIFVQVRAK